MKKAAIAVVIVALLAGGYLAYRHLAAQGQRETVVVRRGTITATVETIGKVRATRQTQLSLPFGGVVRQVVPIGERVSAGDVLLELDTISAEQSVRQAQLMLDLRRRQLDEARAGPKPEDVEIAEANLRKAALAKQVAQAAYDKVAGEPDAATSAQALALQQAAADYQISQANYRRVTAGTSAAELAALETQVETAQIALERAQAGLEATRLTSPLTGTVVMVAAVPGELVPGYRPLLAVADLTALEIGAEVDEIDVAEVQPGQRVAIRLDAFPGQTLTGTVRSLAPAAMPQRGSTVYEAAVDFDPGGLPLRLGMGANLKITTLEKVGVLLVPNHAVQPVGRKKILKVLDGGRVREVEVITGLSNESETEIVSGVEEGAVVLVE